MKSVYRYWARHGRVCDVVLGLRHCFPTVNVGRFGPTTTTSFAVNILVCCRSLWKILLRYLLNECGVDAGKACPTRGRGEGRTSLHWAARGGHVEVHSSDERIDIFTLVVSRFTVVWHTRVEKQRSTFRRRLRLATYCYRTVEGGDLVMCRQRTVANSDLVASGGTHAVFCVRVHCSFCVDCDASIQLY